LKFRVLLGISLIVTSFGLMILYSTWQYASRNYDWSCECTPLTPNESLVIQLSFEVTLIGVAMLAGTLLGEGIHLVRSSAR